MHTSADVSSMPSRIVLAGASGLVGRQVLTQLLADPAVTEVRVLVRRPLTPAGLTGSDLTPGLDKLRVWVHDFERLAEAQALMDGADGFISALGTTIRQAGSREAFRRVDFDYPLQLARMAQQAGVQRVAMVSAIGADASSLFFYNRVKGELENAWRALNFPHATVAHPSLLAGDRSEFRLGERLGLALGFLMPASHKPVQAWQVAAGILASLREGRPGWHVLRNAPLRAMR
jgi:uncharacterized protein YbjT (DUF2867 family)